MTMGTYNGTTGSTEDSSGLIGLVVSTDIANSNYFTVQGTNIAITGNTQLVDGEYQAWIALPIESFADRFAILASFYESDQSSSALSQTQITFTNTTITQS